MTQPPIHDTDDSTQVCPPTPSSPRPYTGREGGNPLFIKVARHDYIFADHNNIKH